SRHCEPEMIEPLIGRDRRRIDAVARGNLRGENHGTAEPEIDSRLTELRRADDFGAEHALEPLRGGFRIRRPQMNVIPSKARHSRLPMTAAQARHDRPADATLLRAGGSRAGQTRCYSLPRDTAMHGKRRTKEGAVAAQRKCITRLP